MIRRNRHFALAALCAAFAGVTAVVQARAIGSFTTKGAYSYVSAPQLHPPKLKNDFTTQTSRLARGYFMVTNFSNVGSPKPMVGQSGPLILDRNLQPVWFFPAGKNVLASNLKQQTLDGKPVLSWWEGQINKFGVTTAGPPAPKWVIVDQGYKQVATLTGAPGWLLSLHDMVIQGHLAWVTAYRTIPANLTPVGGPAAGTLLDSAVQEYDLKTGALLSTWDAAVHIPITESEAQAPKSATAGAWDAYHVNSIQLVKGGRFLVSMRNTWTGYLVDINTGNIVWRLGGKSSTFKFGSNAKFHWQHDVELHGSSKVSVFDDSCCPISSSGKVGSPSGPSRGLVLKLDLAHHKATKVVQYKRGKNFDAAFLGNTQLLSNGNVMVGWGSQPFFSELTNKGKFLFDAFFPTPDISYRAYVFRWTGKPSYAPSGAVRTKNGKTTVYASWNGSTALAAWTVLGGSSSKSLKTVARRVSKTGFETAISLPQTYKAYEVVALDSSGKTLHASASFSKQVAPPSPGFY